MSLNISDRYKGSILIVDDTLENLKFLSTLLAEQGYKVRSVVNGQMALTVARAAQPDLVLLDIKMPDMDGYEVCQRLKAESQTQEIPVIFLSALDEVPDKLKAFKVGGVDYITKPFQLEEVLARVENQLSLLAARAEIRQLNAELELRVIQRTAQLEREIAERQRIQEQLLHMALHDSLTGLPNRVMFMKRLQEVLNRARQHPDHLFAVLFLDCDRFKIVNDSLGHLVGDQLLIAVARRLESCLRPGNTLARLGGDEFTVLLGEIEHLDDATHLADRLQRELVMPFQLDRDEIFIGASIGIVLGTKSYDQPEHVLRDADTAMYQAKAMGKGRYQVFDTGMHYQALELLQLETDLRRAVKRQEFQVHYQPIVSLKTGRLVGFEALTRWIHPTRGLIPPCQFIPLAEDAGLVTAIDLWMIRQACHQLNTWQRQFPSDRPLSISVNLSVKHFDKPNLVEQIDQILHQTGMEGRFLTLEITESAILDNPETAGVILQQLKQRQIRLALDDFGTGYSSMSYLHQFPIDSVKVDRSFISGTGQFLENPAIVTAIFTLAQSLEVGAIAEGIETVQQLSQLRDLGYEYGQGYYFSSPVEAEAATLLMVAPPSWLSPSNA
ncbi:GGDEF domain-containing response regulator [Leptolyngbya sp. 'hensonii']|uniref:EAL domain-containing response regulator n=1 Tax=Leptolyngbya sp. 'hensonii' TaxID=1922337 RepID=UPI00094F5E66|nr:GGDEF domain-containing response regulator [Leptolyngbya sp. 'hensonii']OLP16710.1 GGDEF domain-containing response regulator [Leptolyngbya sp. 'hensonii']